MERESEAFANIGVAIWWCLVTFTTVGYGDVSPVTEWGQIAAAVAMFVGIFFLAMPLAIIGGSFADAWARMDARAEEIFAERRKKEALKKVSHDNPMLLSDDDAIDKAPTGGELAHIARMSALAHMERARSFLEEVVRVGEADPQLDARPEDEIRSQLVELLAQMQALTEANRPTPESVR